MSEKGRLFEAAKDIRNVGEGFLRDAMQWLGKDSFVSFALEDINIMNLDSWFLKADEKIFRC